MTTPNSAYASDLAVETINNYSATLADNISLGNALLFEMMKKGRKRTESGGLKITERLAYAENDTFAWFHGSETLNTADSEVLTAADFEWKEANVNVVLVGRDVAINSDSKSRLGNYVKDRIKVAEMTMKNSVCAAMYASVTTNAKSLNGLPDLVADSTSGTVGSINSATYTFWKNKTFDFSAESTSVTSAGMSKAMNRLWLRCTRGTDKPNLAIADSAYYVLFEEFLQPNQRFTDARMATAGFENLKYKTMPVVYDDQCTASRMYFLNTDFLSLVVHSDYDFKASKEKVSINQNVTLIPMYFMGNLVCSNRSLQGVIQP